MAKKRKTKTTYRRRRRARVGAITGSDVMTVVKAGAVAAGGFIAGKMLSKQEFLQANPGVAAAAQLAGAVIAPMLLKNAVGAGIGMGLAVGAITDVVKMAAPELSASTLGLGFPGTAYPGSTRVPGIVGTQAVVTVD